VLARAKLREIPTQTAWRPEILQQDYAPASLRDLAVDAARNQLIIEELLRGRRDGLYHRSLIFACDIEHAVTLAQLLGRHGVAAAVIHCGMGRAAQDDAIKRFRQGRLCALVNVAMLTEGIDIPEIDAVFLARPTRSHTLLTQMIGRGRRKALNKDWCWIVDCRDNLSHLADQPIRAGTVLDDSSPRLTPRPSGYRPVTRHHDPADAPRFEEVFFPGVGPLVIALGQTFGVEIELTGPNGVPCRGREWTKTANLIIARLRETATAPVWPRPLGFHRGTDLTTWRVTDDRSAGYEIVSPILLDSAGLEELRRVCDGVTALVAEHPDRLRINYRTGLHITLATRLDTNERLRGFVRRVQRVESGLFTLTGPSRLYPYDDAENTYSQREGNQYCQPLRALGDADRLYLPTFLCQGDSRYRTVNLTRYYHDIQTLEVRMHGGTTEFRKIGLWLSLWMQLFNRSRYAWAGPGKVGEVFVGRERSLTVAEVAQEDIIQLLIAEEIALTPEFVHLLRKRRMELRESWRRVLPLRVESWDRAGWYAESRTPGTGPL